MKLSVVTTLYRSRNHIDDFYRRTISTAEKLFQNNFELIFVNDGSPDDSLKKVISISKIDSRVRIVDLSKNHGHHRALMIGLEYASGEYIFLLDSDLEEPPEELIFFYEKLLKNEDLDVVFGVQAERSGFFVKRVLGGIFYKVFNYFSDKVQVPENILTMRIMKKKYVRSLLQFNDQEIYFAPLCAMVGYNQASLKINKESKFGTTYSFFSRYHLFINSILAFTLKPLFFIFYIGLILTIGSIFYVLYLFSRWFFIDVPLEGWTSLMVSLWFLGGVIVLSLGISAIYISKIYTEVKDRPLKVVRNLYGFDK